MITVQKSEVTVKEQPHNSVRRRAPRVTAEGGWAIFFVGWLLLASFMSHISLVLLVFCIVVGVLVVAVVQALRNTRQVDASLRVPDHTFAGRPARLEFVVHNHRRFGAARAIGLSTKLQPASLDKPAAKVSVFLPLIAGRAQASERRELTLPERGLYRFSELELMSRYPFGFFERTLRCAGPQELLVYPRVGKLSRRFWSVERESPLRQEGHRPGVSPEEADYHGLREFRPGDSPRWIHWSTTARRARLMVKEFEARHNRDVAVLLEPWLPGQAGAQDVARLELAISFTATLLLELCQRHSLHVLLGIAGDAPLIRHGPSSEGLLRELLRHLALLRGNPDPHWDGLIAELPPTRISQMRIIVVGPRPPQLVSRLQAANGRAHRKWHRLTRRLVEVDVSDANLRDLFELDCPA